MTETRSHDYAFPIAPGDVPYWHEGMTKREYFMAQAIPAVISTCAGDTVPPGCTRVEYFADQARRIADAMIAASGDKND